jgi:SPP1 gp7 family putative phage head morphogenesis protein
MAATRITVSTQTPGNRKLRARMTHVLHAFFVRQAPKLIGQVVTLRGKVIKADLSQNELDRIEEILAGIDFHGWATLAGEVDDVITEAVRDSGYSALRLAALDVTADKDIFNVVNERAVAWASDRSAELVGMRRKADGSLIVNPRADAEGNPLFAITESTRDMLRADVSTALQEGWTNAELASKLADNYAFSPERAMVIARTETIRASNAGTLIGFKESGVVLLKEWTTAEDDSVSEDCEANGAQGPIELDAEFESGDDAPPAHPNCRCALVGLTRLDIPEEQAVTEESEA